MSTNESPGSACDAPGTTWKVVTPMPSKATTEPTPRTSYCVPRICEYCGAEFLSTLSLIDRGGARFCSKSCAARARPPRPATPPKERVAKSLSTVHTCTVCGETKPITDFYTRKGKEGTRPPTPSGTSPAHPLAFGGGLRICVKHSCSLP